MPNRLDLARVEALRQATREQLVEAIEQRGRFACDDKKFPMFGLQKILLHGVIQKIDETAIVPRDIQQSTGFLVQPELGPAEDFEKFLHGADAAGHRDEGMGRFGHHRFALMHGINDAELRKVSVRNFLFDECRRNDSDNLAVLFQHGISDDTH